MALVFGAGATDKVTITAEAGINNLDPFTWLMWVYPTTLTSLRVLLSKGATTKVFRLNGTGGNIQVQIARASGGASFITNDTPLSTLDKWYCVAAGVDSSAGAGQMVDIYTGDLTTPLAERAYGTNSNGSGALTDESASDLTLGGSASSAFQGRVAVAMIWNRELTLGELIDQQFNPRPTSGCVLYEVMGFNGTGTQPDWSGNAHAGTVTGATVESHVPLRPPFGRNAGWQGNLTPAAATAIKDMLGGFGIIPFAR